MAVEYAFEMGPPATVRAVGAAMAESAASHHMIEEAGEPVRFDQATGDRRVFLRSGVLVANSATSPPPFPDPVEERFGFDPVVSVVFRLNHTVDSFPQLRDMVRLVGAVLTDVSGDALFTFAGELSMLTRIAGRLTVDADSGLWNPDTIALLPPHETAGLPNL